jgi:hypothetical protein
MMFLVIVVEMRIQCKLKFGVENEGEDNKSCNYHLTNITVPFSILTGSPANW